MSWTLALCSILFSLACLPARAEQRLEIGRFHSRALWTPSSRSGRAPAIVLIPGSGSNGPEEAVPGAYTVDGKPAALLSQYALALNSGGAATLALGKPGIEYGGGASPFYDKALYVGLHWQDLVDNLADGVAYLRSRSDVDPARIYVLGHSEGTQVAVDYASDHPELAGVILLGYAGEDMATRLDWQIFRRFIDEFVIPSVDLDRDGFVSRAEAAAWPDVPWQFKPGEDRISYADIESRYRSASNLQAIFSQAQSATLYQGVFRRGPLYEKTAALVPPVYVFTGKLDVETPVREALALRGVCRGRKKDCHVEIVPAVGHAFSPPRPPRAQPLLDLTLGPATAAFEAELEALARGF